MSGIFGGGGNNAALKESQAAARRQEQRGNEAEMRARQLAERGTAPGRGRNMLVGKLSRILPQNLAGVQ